MSLIRDGALAQDDYRLVEVDAPLPSSGRYLLTWARWLTERVTLGDSAASVGVSLPNTLDISAVWDQISDRPLIALEFPAFPDGRAYSQAHLLRNRFGFEGELRAVGSAVVLDQIHGLQRCGFNSFVLRTDQDPASCLAALKDSVRAYQPACDRQAPIRRLRRNTGA